MGIGSVARAGAKVSAKGGAAAAGALATKAVKHAVKSSAPRPAHGSAAAQLAALTAEEVDTSPSPALGSTGYETEQTAAPLAKHEPGPGHYEANKGTRELGFAIRHPFIASQIGTFQSGSTNLSTNAVRFSTNDLGLEETASKEGSEVNAFRHALWQASIANRFGQPIAAEAGNAHEHNPWAVSGSQADVFTYHTEAEADQAADLRNNQIGRSVGGDGGDDKAMNVLALAVLDHFHTHGLWVAEPQEGGTWKVVQRRLTDEEYATARERLLELDADGYDAEQRAERDAD